MTGDKFEVVEAMTRAAVELGWLPLFAESSDKRITVAVRLPIESVTAQRISALATTQGDGRPLPSVIARPEIASDATDLST